MEYALSNGILLSLIHYLLELEMRVCFFLSRVIKSLLRDLKIYLSLSDDSFRLLLSLVNFAIVSFLMGDWRPQIPTECY